MLKAGIMPSTHGTEPQADGTFADPPEAMRNLVIVQFDAARGRLVEYYVITKDRPSPSSLFQILKRL